MDKQLSIDELHIDADAIGSGCSGDVFTAIQFKSGESAIVKIYHSNSVDPAVLNSLYSLQQASPTHPGIAKVLGFELTKNPFYVISELTSGQPLDLQSPPDEDTAWLIIEQLIDILSHAHQYELIHANLHPGNLMTFWENGKLQVKIVDFASGLLGDIRSMNLAENAFFAPPEQLHSYGKEWQNGSGQKWDVYRFGAICYWLLHQSIPRGANYKEKLKSNQSSVTPKSLASAIRKDPTISWNNKYSNNPEISQQLKIIERCLSIDPSDRPSNMCKVAALFDNAKPAKKSELRSSPKKASQEKKQLSSYIPSNLNIIKKLQATSLKTIGLISAAAIAAFSIIFLLVQNQEKNSQLTKLDQLVAEKNTEINGLDKTIKATQRNLQLTRQAVVDATFQSIASKINFQSNDPIELEKARSFYIESLAKGDDDQINKARLLHSLGLVEKSLKINDQAFTRFTQAIRILESLAEQTPKIDTFKRLADCHVNLALLHPNKNHEDVLNSQTMAVKYLNQALEIEPTDLPTAYQMANASIQLGKTLNNNHLFKEAISTFSDAANPLANLRGQAKSKETTEELEQLIAELQFFAAESMTCAGRNSESVDAYIATIESIERLHGIGGYTEKDCLILAKSFLTLGNIFSKNNDISPEDTDQVYNEALRLLSPLNKKDAQNIEVAILLAATLKKIAQLERKSNTPSNAPNLSIRGIESLKHALVKHADHIEGLAQLADSQLAHVVFESNNPANARRITLLALKNAEQAHRLLLENHLTMNPALINQLDDKLRLTFTAFTSLFKSWGDETLASKCENYASIELSQSTSN